MEAKQMRKTKVLIADDHAIVREGLRHLLHSQQDMEVVGEAQDGMDALKRAKELQPDVTLLDIAMPRLSGLEAIHLIKRAVPHTQIVVLSMHQKEAYVHRVLESGALGYVLKASPSSEVLAAIRAVRRNEYFLSSKIGAEVVKIYLQKPKEEPSGSGYDLLSEREQQVFRLLVEGNSVKQVAHILSVSPKTAEKHRANMMKKLGIHDLVALVKYAIKIGIVDPQLWED
jgi:two-component system response regulator NreC